MSDMSRWIDLDGYTWDGTLITSKVCEMRSKNGYLQAISVGWLWGDHVPHFSEKDDVIKHITRSYLEDIKSSLYDRLYLLKDEYDVEFDNDVYMRIQELILCIDTIDKYIFEGGFNV